MVVALLCVLGMSWISSPASAKVLSYPPTVCPTLSISTTTPHPGEAITITGKGFVPGDTITLVFDSADHPLGTAHVADDGTFSVNVTMPSGVTGNHLIIAQGSSDNCPVDPIQVFFPGSGVGGKTTGGLSNTGANVLLGVSLGLALLVAGFALNRGATARRRRAATPGRHTA
jgi:hypothetical protein